MAPASSLFHACIYADEEASAPFPLAPSVTGGGAGHPSPSELRDPLSVEEQRRACPVIIVDELYLHWDTMQTYIAQLEPVHPFVSSASRVESRITVRCRVRVSVSNLPSFTSQSSRSVLVKNIQGSIEYSWSYAESHAQRFQSSSIYQECRCQQFLNMNAALAAHVRAAVGGRG